MARVSLAALAVGVGILTGCCNGDRPLFGGLRRGCCPECCCEVPAAPCCDGPVVGEALPVLPGPAPATVAPPPATNGTSPPPLAPETTVPPLATPPRNGSPPPQAQPTPYTPSKRRLGGLFFP
ncbi:MAG: hypothetical protein NZ700_10725 [Gemmataceae bacterium]|nr:hypothetical protein [Gemmataceae bacterium]MDW8264220.1 hypothetical protein [Gemmataceae bacterium]